MKTFLLPLLVACMLMLVLDACRPEYEQVTDEPDLPLVFSRDTVLFDTLFSTVGSVTKRLKVYNPNDKAVRIEEITLGGSENSPYKVWVQGREGDRFEDEILYGKDSLLLLVEVTIDPEDKNLPFLVKDSVLFQSGAYQQFVKLVAWGQDAHFYKSAGRKKKLECPTVWTADRPYVIYDSLIVPENCVLHIEKGCKIYFNQKAGIYIQGSLQADGTADEPIIFRNIRLDSTYSKKSAQWQGLVFLEGSRDNKIQYAEIRNADVGIWLNTFDEDETPDLTLKNTIIEAMYSAGILAVNSDLEAENVLINHTGQFAAVHLGGGNYTYIHSTLVGENTIRDNEAIVFTDFMENPSDGVQFINPLNIKMINSILWGNREEELLINATEENLGIIEISHNLIRSGEPAYEKAENLIDNSDYYYPKFINPSEYHYQLDSLSPAINQGIDWAVKEDLQGNERDTQPDLGAYEWSEITDVQE